jgi:hypothetical protein
MFLTPETGARRPLCGWEASLFNALARRLRSLESSTTTEAIIEAIIEGSSTGTDAPSMEHRRCFVTDEQPFRP